MNAFASIYLYHPTSDDESEDLRMHISIGTIKILRKQNSGWVGTSHSAYVAMSTESNGAKIDGF